MPGIDLHVWVDETRPRNQGAALTAWELGRHGVPHTIIADNAGGHLMQHGRVDLAIVGADRVTAHRRRRQQDRHLPEGARGARQRRAVLCGVPPSTIDWTARRRPRRIPIEERAAEEVTAITGRAADGAIVRVDVAPAGSPAANPAFDVTPARLVTGLITERGRCSASATGLAGLFPERLTDRYRPNRRLRCWKARTARRKSSLRNAGHSTSEK